MASQGPGRGPGVIPPGAGDPSLYNSTKPSDKMVDGMMGRGLNNRGRQFFAQGDSRILSWINEAVGEGDGINRADPNYDKVDRIISYIDGNHSSGDAPSYLPKVTMNQSKKAARAHVSALTDVKPLFGYRVANPAFQQHSHTLNQLTTLWWVNTMADVGLGDAVKYSLVAGAGDISIEWDAGMNNGLGDIRLIARDPRDTIPIRPTKDLGLQSWEGVVLREEHSVNSLRAMYPDAYAKGYMDPNKTGIMAGVVGKIRTVFNSAVAAMGGSTLDGLKGGQKATRAVPGIVLHRLFIKDRSINATAEPIAVGQPGTNWFYLVPPGAPLYPYGRTLGATEAGVLWDLPNPYWHGMFPLVRLKLDPWPWLFAGSPLLGDTLDLQDALNGMTREFMINFKQHTGPTTAWDRSMAESEYKRYDPRRQNQKIRMNPTVGEGFKMITPPTIPPWAFEFLQFLFNKHDEYTGTANLQALMQLRQMPGADTIQKYYEALTPELRLESRMVEVALRELAEQIKVNFFQFYSTARRIMLLGDPGLAVEDLDFDPDDFVPAIAPTDEGYIKELDGNLPRHTRAQFFHRLFSFYVTPNSILAMHAQERQMLYIQLSRQGYMDFWSLMEQLQIPNAGSPPPVPLPPIDPQPMMIDPMTGQPIPPPPEMRIPTTITERLQAQALLGIGMAASPAGRKASGNQPPELKQKGDGSTTMSESG